MIAFELINEEIEAALPWFEFELIRFQIYKIIICVNCNSFVDSKDERIFHVKILKKTF